MENINKERRTFSELVRDFRLKPDQSITTQIDFDTHPFRGNKFFSFSPNKLAADEFARCFELMQNRMPEYLNEVRSQRDIMNLMAVYMTVTNQITLIEGEHKESLEDLAVALITDLYNVPDNVDLRAFLTPVNQMPINSAEGGGGGDGDDDDEAEEEDLSPERKEYIQKEIQKRIILNTLVHGSSVHIWKSSYHIARNQLNIMDERLVGLYDKYSALVSFLMWQFSVQQMQQMIDNNAAIVQGVNHVEFAANNQAEEPAEEEENDEEDNYLGEDGEDDEGEVEIDATLTGYAINFPVLLHELSKAVVDYLITNGIPQDLTKKEYSYYYSMADRYRDEIWHYFFGPTLWVNLLETVDKTPDELPYVISKMAELDYDQLAELCNLIIYDKERARRRMEILEIIED